MDYVHKVPFFPKLYMFVFTHSPSLNEETIDKPRMRILNLVLKAAHIEQHSWKTEAIFRYSYLILSQSGRFLYILIAFLCSFAFSILSVD